MAARDLSRQPSVEEHPFAQRYETHGKEVLDLLFHYLNRFVDFLRAEKGQFWVAPYRDAFGISSTASKFNAKACIDGGAWFRWQPSQTTQLELMVPGETEIPRYVTAGDWLSAQRFLESDSRPNLARQLLAGAELLAAVGHGRAALTEATTALEVALFTFAKSKKAHEVLPPELCGRMGVESLEKLIEHMGLTATVDYLLPIMFTEKQMPTGLLKTCRAAISQRQNVVHQGQRRVEELSLKRFLAALRSLCDILLQNC
jgi:hypothetical protein